MAMLRQLEAVLLIFRGYEALNEVTSKQENQRHAPQHWKPEAWNKPQPVWR